MFRYYTVYQYFSFYHILSTILGYASIPIIHSLLRDIIYQLIIQRDNFEVIISQHNFVINLCLRFISRFGRFYEDFTLPFTLSLYPFHLSIHFTSLSLSLSYLSLPLYISPSIFFLSLFSLSFSLAYLMDVFIFV